MPPDATPRTATFAANATAPTSSAHRRRRDVATPHGRNRFDAQTQAAPSAAAPMRTPPGRGRGRRTPAPSPRGSSSAPDASTGCRPAAVRSPPPPRRPRRPRRAGSPGTAHRPGLLSAFLNDRGQVGRADPGGQREAGQQDRRLGQCGHRDLPAGAHPAERGTGVETRRGPARPFRAAAMRPPRTGQRPRRAVRPWRRTERPPRSRRVVATRTTGAAANTQLDPCGRIGSLRKQLAQIAPRLADAGTRAALEPGPDLPHQPDQVRRSATTSTATTWTTTADRRSCWSGPTTTSTPIRPASPSAR